MAPYLLNVPKDVPSANVVVNNDNDNPTEGGEEEDIVPLLATGEEGEEEEEDETSDEEEEESLAEIEVDTEDEDEPVAAAAGAAAAAVSKGGNGEDEIETVSLGNEDAEGEDLSQPIISKKSSPSSRKSLPLLQDGNTASSSPAAAAGASTPEEAAASSEEVNPLSSKPRLLLRSMRTQGRRILVEPFERLYEIYDPPEPSCDILSIVIHCQMWHLADKILGHLDALSLKTCEEVCLLWRTYIQRENIWRKLVQQRALLAPDLARQNGWAKLIPALGGTEPEDEAVTKTMYWKMTNVAKFWSRSAPSEHKNHFKRSGSIGWCFLPDERTVSVYNSGRGFTIKVHDNMTFKPRLTQKVTLGTVKKDTLCVDASENRIVIGGLTSQKVWVFNVKEKAITKRATMDIIKCTVTNTREIRTRRVMKMSLDMFKFILAGVGVTKVKLHSDEKRMAVLTPINQTVQIWDIQGVVRLQSYTVPTDACYLFWERDLLVTAPLYSGVIQTINTSLEVEINSIVGSIRRIDALTVYKTLCATAESRWVKLWSLTSGKELIHWSATKTFMTSLFMNDTLIVTGSSAGIVKIWDLNSLLRKNVKSVVPLTRISMKGVMHYPIKAIHQWEYTDLIIMAKYEAKKKKDKVKIVKVRGGRR